MFMDKYIMDLTEFKIFKYVEIANHIKRLIDKNIIKDGEKLPSIRKMSEKLNVNNVTVVNAYKKLEDEGYIVQRVGSGSYAKRRELTVNFKKNYANIIRNIEGKELKKYIDFSGEAAASNLFTIDPFKNVINEVLDRDGIRALIYQESLGYEGLRQTISEHFWKGSVNKNDILIVSGAQQGIDIASKALINVNDGVVVENPTYSGALNVFKWRRANIFEVSVKHDGMDLDELEKIVKKNKIKCVYLMSYFQNPTGSSYSKSKKRRLLNMAEIYDFYIIEDDYLSELIYNDREYLSFKSMDTNDRVVYIKSFSKVFLPGIRLGYVISPSIFNENFQKCKVDSDIATSSLMQRVLDIYIKEGIWREYIDKLKKVYKERYLFMEESLKQLKNAVNTHSPNGGLHFYMEIKNTEKNSMELFYECKENKLLITPGVIFYKNPKEGEKYFRIGFSQTDMMEISKGINILKKILG